MKLNVQYIEIKMAELGLTQTQLAVDCGLSRQNVGTILRRGTCMPKTAGKLARGLMVPVGKVVAE